MLLTACASHSSTRQSNVWFRSSLAVNTAHVLIKEVNKSTQNKNSLLEPS